MFKFFNKSVETVLFDASKPNDAFQNGYTKEDVFGTLKNMDLVKKKAFDDKPENMEKLTITSLKIKESRKGVFIELEVDAMTKDGKVESKKIELTAKEFHEKFSDIKCKDDKVNEKLHGTGRGIA